MRLYPRLAVNSIKSNRQLYFPYILMSSGIIAIFYIMAALSESEEIKACKGGHSLVTLLGYSIYIIAFFALLFMFFTNSFVIKRRTKEFGLYNILGMNKKNIAGIMVWETLIMYASSLAAGLVMGILFSELAQAGLVKLAQGTNRLGFSISLFGVKCAVLVFAGIFFLIFLNSVRVGSFSNPAQMIRAENLGEKPPRANYVIGILGLVLIAAAYVLVLTINNRDSNMVILNFVWAVFPVIAGTYFIFIAGSVLLCKIMQKNGNYYYNKKHFVSVANMAFRMKRSGAGLATIAILTTMVLIMLTSTICFYSQIQSVLDSDFPRQNVFVGTFGIEDDSRKITLAEAEDLAERTSSLIDGEDLVWYSKINFVANGANGEYKITGKNERHDAFDKNDSVFSLIPLSTYNRITGNNISLADDEVLLSSLSLNKFKSDSLSFGDGRDYKVKPIEFDLYSHGRYYIDNYLVVMNDVSSYEASASGITSFVMFNKDMSDKEISALGKKIYNEFKSDEKEGETPYRLNFECDSRDVMEEEFISIYTGLIFLGIVLTILFLAATILLMYYRQISEGHEDYGKYRILKNIGMTAKDIRTTVDSMTLITFLSPLVAAIVHTSVAMYFVYQFMILQGMFDIRSLFLTAATVYLAFTVVYFICYKLTSRSYLKIVNGI